MFKTNKLLNGITLLTVPVAGTEAVTVLALFPVGSRYETARQSGISHFIEHLMFKGTAKRPATLDISRELDKVGAEYNAYTGRDHTGYYVKVSADKIELALDLLSDMLWHSKFDKDEIEREKGVIVEELNMYKDNPTMYVEELFEELMYKNNSLGRDIGGTPKTVRAASREMIISYYHQFYNPHNLVLVVAGKIGKNIRPMIDKYFSMAGSKKIKPTFPAFSFPSRSAMEASVHFKKTDQTHLAMGFPGFSYDDPRSPALALLNIILGATMSSRLFTEVRERRGLAYVIQSGLNRYHETGNLVIKAGLDKSRLAEAMKVILAELEKIKKQGVMYEELQTAKDNLAGHMILQLEDSSAQADWYGRAALLKKKIRTPQEELAIYRAVKLPEIKKIANQIFQMPRLRLSAIGPYQDNLELKKMLKTSIM
ncbi:MAG: pitrilysin family protein [Patescibacteria group bacterium]